MVCGGGAGRKNVLPFSGAAFLPEPTMTAPQHAFPITLSPGEPALAPPAPPEPPVALVDVDGLRQRVHDRLTQQLDPRALRGLSDDQRRAILRPAAEKLVDEEAPALSLADRERLIAGLLDHPL